MLLEAILILEVGKRVIVGVLDMNVFQNVFGKLEILLLYR